MVKTEWKVRVREFPKTVTDAIAQGGYRLNDDEADFVRLRRRQL